MEKSELKIHNQEHFDSVYEFAIVNNVLREFIAGIHYLMTYGESRDRPIYCDLYSDPSCGGYSFVASISYNVFNYEKNGYVKKHYMTIGMVWHESQNNWGFHS